MTTGAHAALPVGTAVPSLRRWGLSADADLVYRTLVTFGPRRLTAAARELGLSPRRVGAALEELAAAGVVRPPTARGSEGMWTAVPPARALHAVRRARQPAAPPWERARRHLAAVAGVGLDVVDGDAGVRVLQGRERVRDRIAELMAAERTEHLAINPEPRFEQGTVAAAAPLDLAILERGVRLLSLGLPPSDGDIGGAAHTDELIDHGAQTRVRQALPLKLIVFDRRTALVPVDPLVPTRGAVEVATPGLVQALVALFFREWESARDPRRGGVPPVVLTPREKTLVELLAAGHTDASAAKRLGCSPRTVSYTLRALMDRFGVENRFQLGLALGTLGAHALSAPDRDTLVEEER